MTKRLTRRSFMQAGLIAGASIAYPPFAFSTDADWKPTRPVRVVVPYPPGGATDIVARLVCEGLNKQFDQPFIVENRSGASGTIGTAYVANAAGDGHTIVISLSTSLMLSQFQYKNLPYNPRKDLKLMSLLAHIPILFCVPGDVEVNNLQEFTEYAKANQGKLSFGTYGDGSHPHLILDYLNQTLGTDLLHVPYRGEAPTLQALIAKEIQVGVSSAIGAAPQIKSGNLKAFAVLSHERLSFLPDVATFAEQGMTDSVFTTLGWIATAAPGSTSPHIVETLSKAINNVILEASMKERLANELGVLAVGTTPTRFEETYDQDAPVWKMLFENSSAQVIG